MKRPDWEAWEPEEPAPGFSERVVTAAMREERAAAPAGRARRALAGLLLVAAMAAAVALTLHLRHANARGDVSADARLEVRVGTRATAVLENGARVAWNGEDVRQDKGDVFWRVEPGVRFVVHTPAGEVTVKGTCFRIRVLAGVATVAGAIGVLVYEGKVSVSHAGTGVDLVAGESAEADERGVHRTGALADESLLAKDEAAHAVAKLDRARVDRMREQLRALFAEAGALASAATPSVERSASPAADASGATMPVLGTADDGTPQIDPTYIQKRIQEDLLPLAKGCYSDALKRDPTMAGKLAVYFRIIGDRKVGGVVDEAKMTDDSTLADPELQTCVRESMMSISFDAPPGDREVTVIYPIVFSPVDDDAGPGR